MDHSVWVRTATRQGYDLLPSLIFSLFLPAAPPPGDDGAAAHAARIFQNSLVDTKDPVRNSSDTVSRALAAAATATVTTRVQVDPTIWNATASPPATVLPHPAADNVALQKDSWNTG